MISKDILHAHDACKQQLAQPFAIFRNALRDDIAEALYQDMSQFALWEPDTVSTLDNFSYSRRKIRLEDPKAPPSLGKALAYFRSTDCLNWINSLTGRNCTDFYGSAIKMLPGDHVSKHNDRYVATNLAHDQRMIRTVTFNYYLARDWKEEYGGEFIWDKPYQKIVPEFNMLVMFLVGADSNHNVEPVTSLAKAPRLSISGWFIKPVQAPQRRLVVSGK